jgi:hypothetical protein
LDSVATTLNAIGILLEVVGVAVAAIGLARTWGEFGPGDEGLVPVKQLARGARRHLAAVARRVGLKPRGKVVGMGAVVTGSGSVKARGRMQFRSLPADIDTPEALAELDDRTRRLMTIVSDVRDATVDEKERAEAREDGLAEELETATQHLESQDRRVAIGGVRLEALGLFLVALGLLMQAVPT